MIDASKLQSTEGRPVPWGARLVNLIRIDADGGITATHTVEGKRTMLADMTGATILVAWPGQYSQEVFLLHDAALVLAAIGASPAEPDWAAQRIKAAGTRAFNAAIKAGASTFSPVANQARDAAIERQRAIEAARVGA